MRESCQAKDDHPPAGRMNPLISKLQGGDLRSIGRANEVVAEVLKSPALLDQLFEGLFVDDLRVRARSADALEKVSAKRPEWLHPYRGRLIGKVANIEQKEVRWHLAQIIGRLKWTARQRTMAVTLLRTYLKESDSEIVKVSALQALADLAVADSKLKASVSQLICESLEGGSPSLRARARKLAGHQLRAQRRGSSQ